MPDLFGAPLGDLAFREDARQQQLAQLSLAEGSIKLQSAQLALNQQKRMLAAISSGDVQNAPDMPSQMDRLAQVALSTGNPEQAREYAATASTLRKHQAEIADAQISQQIKGLNFLGSLYQDVNDDATKRLADAYYQKVTGKPSPVAGMPYNPLVIEKLKTGVQSAKDRALTQAAQARVEATKQTEQEAKARIPLIKAQTREAQIRADKLSKEGASDKAPSENDLKVITDLMATDYGTSSKEQARALARPIAERMLQLRKQGNLSQSEAAQRAYEEAKGKGDLAGIRPGSTTRAGIVDDIDDIIDQIRATPGMTGARGFLKRGKEVFDTATGFGDQETPAHRFQTSMESLLLRLPKALTNSGKSAKDERQRVDALANALKVGVTDEIAVEKLDELKRILVGAPPGVQARGAQGAVKVTSPEEAAALAPGTVFITPDGQRRVRK